MSLKATVKLEVRNAGAIGKAIDRVRRALGGRQSVKVGFPAGKVKGDIADRAVWNEFGTSRGIPERPFMRITMKSNEGKYKRFMASKANGLFRGQGSITQALQQLGVMAVSDIQRTISSGVGPANAPSTVKAKGSSHTLIDSGEMRAAVSYDLD